MDQLPRRLTEIWNSLSPTRRVMLAATGGGLVALALLLYSWSSSINYITLYAGLDPSDSGRIVDQLRSRGIPFQLDPGGSTIRVSQDQVDELRLDFATQGLPDGGQLGFEIFDGNSFVATDFVQRLNFQRGLQGELARTIETFSAVENARVHIVLPERSLFVTDERPATAAVVLQMRPGRALATDEIAGVAHLISGAVEGLDKVDITIIDTSGSVLYDGRALADESALGASGNQLALQRSFEEALERDVRQLLDQALGPAKSAVQVHATLNFDRLETETETFFPGQAVNGSADTPGVLRSSTTVTESYSTSGEGGGSVALPGAFSNIPGADTDITSGVTSGEESTTYARNEELSNCEVGHQITRSVTAVGGVESLSVSLLLDDSVSATQVVSLTAAVAAAVGINEARGDTIVVSSIPFDRTAIEEAAAAFAADASTQQLFGYVRMALPVLVLLVAFVFFQLLMRSLNKRGNYRVVDASGGMLPAGVAIGGGELSAGPVGLPAARAGAALPAPEAEDIRSDVERQVTRMAEAHPGTVANVVQSWLREE